MVEENSRRMEKKVDKMNDDFQRIKEEMKETTEMIKTIIHKMKCDIEILNQGQMKTEHKVKTLEKDHDLGREMERQVRSKLERRVEESCQKMESQMVYNTDEVKAEIMQMGDGGRCSWRDYKRNFISVECPRSVGWDTGSTSNSSRIWNDLLICSGRRYLRGRFSFGKIFDIDVEKRGTNDDKETEDDPGVILVYQNKEKNPRWLRRPSHGSTSSNCSSGI